jgi:hypothetical protein
MIGIVLFLALAATAVVLATNLLSAARRGVIYGASGRHQLQRSRVDFFAVVAINAIGLLLMPFLLLLTWAGL